MQNSKQNSKWNSKLEVKIKIQNLKLKVKLESCISYLESHTSYLVPRILYLKAYLKSCTLWCTLQYTLWYTLRYTLRYTSRYRHQYVYDYRFIDTFKYCNKITENIYWTWNVGNNVHTCMYIFCSLTLPDRHVQVCLMMETQSQEKRKMLTFHCHRSTAGSMWRLRGTTGGVNLDSLNRITIRWFSRTVQLSFKGLPCGRVLLF